MIPVSGSGPGPGAGRSRGRPRKPAMEGDEEDPPPNPHDDSEDGDKRTRKKPKPYVSEVNTLSFPVTERDEAIVECGACHEKSTFRQFRIHNLTAHYNIASTTDDSYVRDHKFFTRKLTEMARLMKLTTFKCPMEGCDSRFKSAGGLGYHLENCGKRAINLPVDPREKEMVECSMCHEKSTFAEFRIHNIKAHYNIASTTDDNNVRDYRFFTRKLTEMGRLLKLTTFNCPTKGCDNSKYKSALGLGYHLENCGKQRPASKDIISLPMNARDLEMVECSSCHEKCTFAQFKAHNIKAHYNIASTTDDTEVRDYRFFSRKLTELGRIMKLAAFSCPNEGCDSKYKSALGLGYHLENCGKSLAEIRAGYVTCDICNKKYPKANLNFHKKSHTLVKTPKFAVVITTTTHPGTGKQLRPKKVQKSLAERDSTETDEGGNDDGTLRSAKQEVEEGDDDDDSDSDEAWPIKLEPDEDHPGSVFSEAGAPSIVPSTHEDISFHAHQSLTHELESGVNMWDKPQRFSANIFQDLWVNPLLHFESDEMARSYLPNLRTSIEFQTKIRTQEQLAGGKSRISEVNPTDFHRLEVFDSEMAADSMQGHNILFVGGPVSSASWHPSGKYLAVATLRNNEDKPNMNELESNQTCIQIYVNPSAFETPPNASRGLQLKFVFGIENGFIHNLQWSSFWPLACESDSVTQLFSDEDFIGHLAYAGGDSSVNVVFVRKSYFDMEPNVQYSSNSDKKITFYKKQPEIRLQLRASAREEAGQCITFNWHEKSEYVAAGYANGLVAIFNMQTTSRLLRKIVKDPENNSKTLELEPFWYIRAHTEPVTVTVFNPANPRYLVTCSHDYFIKTWDVELRREMECKKIGMVLDGCWIRGWIHMAISTEYLNVNFQIGNYNLLKFYQVGNSKGYSSCADMFNITSVSFYEGMVAQATEVGRVSIAYYDQFLRECDYDRNKKKKNTVDFSSVSVDKVRDKRTNTTEAKLVFMFQNTRREFFGNIPEPTMDDAEDYVVFYNLVRINKIAWCPTGNQLATGYNSGFLTVAPACFSDLFKNYR